MAVAAPKIAGNLFIPAEWAPQKAIWTGWPSHADLWLENLEPARVEVASMIKTLSEGCKVRVLAMGDEAAASARTSLGDSAEVLAGKFGDIWFRDTGPIFTADGKALCFLNNSWGGKYELPFDDTVGDEIAAAQKTPIEQNDFILEGGAIEQDGEGTILTTRQCVLNPNRNKGWTEEKAEALLKAAFGAKKILWLDEGLVNDHTDGHVDNIVRFIAPGKVVCQRPFGKDDPNAAVFKKITYALEQMTDAEGRKLEIFRISSPGRMENQDGDVIPSSHMNFIISNKIIVVPTYGTASTDEAVKAIAKLFPDHKAVGLPSNALLSGGGSFHCITQQVPA